MAYPTKYGSLTMESAGLWSPVMLGLQGVRNCRCDLVFTSSVLNISVLLSYAGRMGHTSAVLPDGTLFVQGGSIVSGVSNEVWKSVDGGGMSWTLVTNNAWASGGKDPHIPIRTHLKKGFVTY